MYDIIHPLTAMGLMSGTSLDGVDAAMILTDGIDVHEFGAFIFRPYEKELKEKLRSVLGRRPHEDDDGLVQETEREMTLFHAHVAQQLLEHAVMDAEDVDIIGFHGHTLLHRPAEQLTFQIGDGALLAQKTGIDVVNRFRNVDVKSGGQGAPLVPCFHDALCRDMERPLCVLNLGGVANVTWIGSAGEMIAFDTGPGNALIDDWVYACNGSAMDDKGDFAAAGTVNEKVLAKLMRQAYFGRTPPKSLDRDDFYKASQHVQSMSLENGAATLTAFTTEAIRVAQIHLPTNPEKWIVCGGGQHNATMMRMLRNKLDAKVIAAEDVGWKSDFIEAQAFAFLASRSVFGLPYSFPSTTGVPKSSTGGSLHRADNLE